MSRREGGGSKEEETGQFCAGFVGKSKRWIRVIQTEHTEMREVFRAASSSCPHPGTSQPLSTQLKSSFLKDE